MDHNESIWDRYRPGYVDPLYVPYLRTTVKDPKGNYVNINTWEKIGYSNGMVSPDLVRINWNTSFARKHAYDPCPVGFRSGEGGYCFPMQPEHEPVFYTEKAFLPKRQFFGSYIDQNRTKRVSDSFDMRSVSPFTGKYTTFYEGTEDRSYAGNSKKRNGTIYGKNPTSDSYN